MGGGGGKICNIREKTQARARSARAGGGSGRGVPPPRRRSFCIFEIEIKRSGAHFGWIFLGKLPVKKVRRKYIFMVNVCFLHYDNGKCKEQT